MSFAGARGGAHEQRAGAPQRAEDAAEVRLGTARRKGSGAPRAEPDRQSARRAAERNRRLAAGPGTLEYRAAGAGRPYRGARSDARHRGSALAALTRGVWTECPPPGDGAAADARRAQPRATEPGPARCRRTGRAGRTGGAAQTAQGRPFAGPSTTGRAARRAAAAADAAHGASRPAHGTGEGATAHRNGAGRARAAARAGPG